MKWKSSSSDFCFYILILACVVEFAIGIFNGLSLNYKEKYCTEDMSVKIVRVARDTRTRGRRMETVYTPYFVYNSEGRVFNGHAKYTTTEKKYEVGDLIKIKINPENPKIYLVENDITHYNSSYDVGKTFGVITLIFILFTIVKKLI